MSSSQHRSESANAAAAATVLLVEDDVLLRSTMAEVLRLEQYEVLEAADATEAKRMLEAIPGIALVLSDIQMPGDDNGIDLARHIQAHHPGMPVMLVSGAASDPNLDSCRFLRKPFQLQKLLSVARCLLSGGTSLNRK